MGDPRLRRGPARFLLVVLGLLTALLLVPTIAVASDIQFSSPSPAPGTTYGSSTPWVTLRVKDTAAIPLPQTAWVDGVPAQVMGVYAELSGHWEVDPNDWESDIWVVDEYDYTDVTLYISSSQLTDGPHAVSVKVTGARGDSAEYSWSFDIASGPSVYSWQGWATPWKYATSTVPTISVPFADNGGSHTATITLNGTPIPTQVDGNRIVGKPAFPLTENATYTVNATVSDQDGRAASGSWSFRVVTGGGMSVESIRSVAYAPGAIPSIYATATHTMPLVLAQLLIDNREVSSAVPTKVGTDRWTYSGYDWYVSDGTHTATVTFKDEAGNAASASTTFSVNVPPSLYLNAPQNGARLETATPDIIVIASDNGTPVPPSLELRLDGQIVQTTRFGSQFNYKPATPLEGDTTHTITATARDVAGNVTTGTWSFWVPKYSRMQTSSCTSCHSSAQHQGATCLSCHTFDYHGDGPICWDCHRDPRHNYTNCAACHRTQAALSHENGQGAPHQSTTEFAKCSSCHSTSLSREHGRYTNTTGQPFGCLDCHKSTNPKVTTAIAASRTDCAACHDANHPHRSSADTSTVANSERTCGSCHAMDVVVEHAKPTASTAANACDACHAGSSSPRNAAGAWNQRCDSAGCHAAGSSRAVHDNYCIACHEVGNPGFATPAAEVDFAEGRVVRETACRKCHWLAPGTHPFHNTGASCGGCHPGWGKADLSRVPKANTPAGGFFTAASADASADELHAIHLSASWPAAFDKPNSRCASCHAAASCDSCHEDPDATHGDHTLDAATGTRGAVAPAVRTASGTPEGDQKKLTAATASVPCAASGCHAGFAGGAATIEDGNPALSYTGSWRAQSSSQFSGGTLRYADAPGASVAATLPGGAFTVVGTRNYLSGMGEVLVDGAKVGTFDAYSAASANKQVLFRGTVPAGEHRVAIRVAATRNPSAGGYRLYFDALTSTAGGDIKTPKCSSCHADKIADHGGS